MEGAERLLKPPLERLIPLKTPPFEPTPPAPLPARPSSLPESAPFQDILILEKEHQWTASTHVFPAAWPRTRLRGVQGRTKRFQPIHNLRPTPKGKEATVKEAEWLVAHQEGAGFIDLADPATYIDQDQLWVSVNRYAPVAPRARPTPGYTLVFSHATGLHKETYEAAIAQLIARGGADDIDEIWSLDCANQGDSSILNRGKLGDTFFWPDSGRDICKFLLQYLPALGDGSALSQPPRVLQQQPLADPTLLDLDSHRTSPVNPQATDVPTHAQPWRGRRIIGSGHSLGGGCTNYAASSLPSLFTGLVYVDPILPPESQRFRDKLPITGGALSRRDSWENREAAARSFAAKATFFGRWDPAVLRRYVEFDLAPLSSGGVELKGPKRDEALVFADTPSHSGETGAGTRVAYLPGWLARRTFFVLPDVGQSVYPEHAVAETLANAKGCRHVRVSGAAHLVVQERPQDVAEAIDGHLRWLTKEEGRAVAKL